MPIPTEKDGTLSPTERKRWRNKAVRAIDALRCCEQQQSRTMGKVVGLVNDIMGLLARADGKSALGLVPVAGAPWLLRAVTLSPAEIAAIEVGSGGTAVAGAIVLLSAIDMFAIAQEKGVYDALSLFGTAIGTLQRKEAKECETCLKNRLMSQARRRKRIRVKILRRL